MLSCEVVLRSCHWVALLSMRVHVMLKLSKSEFGGGEIVIVANVSSGLPLRTTLDGGNGPANRVEQDW